MNGPVVLDMGGTSFASIEQVDRDHDREGGSEAGDDVEKAEVREDLGLPLLPLCRFGPRLGVGIWFHSLPLSLSVRLFRLPRSECGRGPAR